MADDPTHIDKEDVRGGETRGGRMRTILTVSLVLIVIAFGALFLYYR